MPARRTPCSSWRAAAPGLAAALLAGAITAAAPAAAAEPVKVAFDSAAFTYPPSPFKVRRARKLGRPVAVRTEPAVALSGQLARPDTAGPHPAVVLLHTCAGITEHERWWADRLVEWGYVVLTVDSLTPRALDYICDGPRGAPGPWLRALDAFGAKRHLSALPFVDAGRIGVMGMSHGATAVLDAIKDTTSAGLGVAPFGAAVALYPLCGEPAPVATPTVMLMGAEDLWHPAAQCQRYVNRMQAPHDVSLTVFPDAHHAFDHPDIDMVEVGYVLRTEPVAAARTVRLIRSFLQTRL